MFAIGNDELKELPYAVDEAGKKGWFKIVHTNKDGSTEVCKVTSSIDSDGLKIWTIGGYTTKDKTTYLAVVAGKILKNIVLYKPKKKV